jgi:hypothetical protein
MRPMVGRKHASPPRVKMSCLNCFHGKFTVSARLRYCLCANNSLPYTPPPPPLPPLRRLYLYAGYNLSHPLYEHTSSSLPPLSAVLVTVSRTVRTTLCLIRIPLPLAGVLRKNTRQILTFETPVTYPESDVGNTEERAAVDGDASPVDVQPSASGIKTKNWLVGATEETLRLAFMYAELHGDVPEFYISVGQEAIPDEITSSIPAEWPAGIKKSFKSGIEGYRKLQQHA